MNSLIRGKEYMLYKNTLPPKSEAEMWRNEQIGAFLIHNTQIFFSEGPDVTKHPSGVKNYDFYSK